MFTITDGRLGNKTAAALGALLLLLAAPAYAQTTNPDCSTLPNPVYGIGGSAQSPLLGKVGAALAGATPATTVIYQAPGACVGVNAIIGNTALTGTATYFDTTGKSLTCNLPLAGQAPDFGVSGNSATSCPGVTALPTGIGDFTGPVDAYTLIVPNASQQQNISKEAAYFVFGFGNLSQAKPWIDETQIFIRDENSAAQLFISIATGVPATKFKGKNTLSNSGTIQAVAGASNPLAAIGLVSGEVADANRATVRVLAYQHSNQRCAFWPDSTVTALDKRSVRNGQYWLWAPVHLFTKVDATGTIPNTNPALASFIHYFDGTVAAPTGVDMLSLETKAGLVPKCAMNVTRTGDLGDLVQSTPDQPCGCYFEKVATGTTTCTACTTNAQCGGSNPTCRNGYCEAK